MHNIEENIILESAMKCFHAMLWVKPHIIDLTETYETEKPAKPAQSAVFATKMLPTFQPVGSGSTGGELTRKTSSFGLDMPQLGWQGH
jgi:hypothetical protein